ncbi:hypothetical protein GLYMA_20G142400v4 [Glycine max]|nr:hypothetical protein GLYMA_20G142400v4 [Glycine max]KAH1036063.1 hypothetical protein GYH30_055837 [Glycine max]
MAGNISDRHNLSVFLRNFLIILTSWKFVILVSDICFSYPFYSHVVFSLLIFYAKEMVRRINFYQAVAGIDRPLSASMGEYAVATRLFERDSLHPAVDYGVAKALVRQVEVSEWR